MSEVSELLESSIPDSIDTVLKKICSKSIENVELKRKHQDAEEEILALLSTTRK